MALSNWDTFAVDLDGKPMGGRFVTPDGLSVEISKNYLLVRSPAGEFSITEGRVLIGFATIIAKRVRRKDALLVCVTHRTYREQGGPQYVPPVVTGMVGIGCYGYRGGTWIGVEPRDVARLERWLALQVNAHEIDAVPPLDGGRRFNQGDAFFADHLSDAHLRQETAPGEARPSILSRMWGDTP